jgi:hypothetical protein
VIVPPLRLSHDSGSKHLTSLKFLLLAIVLLVFILVLLAAWCINYMTAIWRRAQELHEHSVADHYLAAGRENHTRH